MSGIMESRPGYRMNLDPAHWLMATQRVLLKSLFRLWGRNVMLYTGGVSFFALLAVFPAVAILIGVYSLLLTPAAATAQASSWVERELGRRSAPGSDAISVVRRCGSTPLSFNRTTVAS